MCNHVISSLIMCLVGGIKWDRLGWGHFFRFMVTTYKTIRDGIIPPWNIPRISGNRQNFQIEGTETAYLNHTRSQAKRTCLRTGLIPPTSMGRCCIADVGHRRGHGARMAIWTECKVMIGRKNEVGGWNLSGSTSTHSSYIDFVVERGQWMSTLGGWGIYIACRE